MSDAEVAMTAGLVLTLAALGWLMYRRGRGGDG